MPKKRLLPTGALSSRMPSGVTSTIHATTSAIGKPSSTSSVTSRGAQSGRPSCGATVAPTCTTSHATTR